MFLVSYYPENVYGQLSNLTFTAAELESISTGFAIGFGSFVDKNTLPFALNSYKR